MSVLKKRFPITLAALVVMLGIVFYFVFFFNKTTINVDNMEKLTQLMSMDFSDVEITDIQYKYVKDEALRGTRTQIFVFLKESGELETKDYYFDSDGGGIFDPELEHIPPGHVESLKEIGIESSQIQKHGGNYNQIKVGFWIVPYTIHWYQINESYDGKSNVVLFASVPRKISGL